ncbi:unnamed protein product, partial [Ectocarpus sp. 4 AP-2014]
EWLNIHAVWKLCAGATTSDGGKYKNATLANGEIVGRPCSCSDPGKKVDDIKEGCTGDIQEGEYVARIGPTLPSTSTVRSASGGRRSTRSSGRRRS